MTKSRRQKLVWVASIALVVSLALLLSRKNGLVLLIEKNTTLVINDLKVDSDEHNRLRVAGRTNLPADVILKIGSLAVKEQKTGANGKFEFNNIITAPGRVDVEILAGCVIGTREHLAKSKQSFLFTAGQISGLVKDSQGRRIKNANVTLVEQTKTQSRPVDERGEFLFSALPPGDYTVTVKRDGAQEISHAVQLNPDDCYRFAGEFVLAAPHETSSSNVTPKEKCKGPAVLDNDPRSFSPPLSRAVEADVRYRTLDVRLRGELASGDRRVVLLNSCLPKETRCLRQFIRLVFGEFAIKDQPLYLLSLEKDDNLPRAPLTSPAVDGKTAFTLESLGNSRHEIGTLTEEWPIVTDWRQDNSSIDSFHFKLTHYNLGKKEPEPSVTTHPAHDVTWTAKDGAPAEIKTSINYDFKDPFALARVAWTSPYALVRAEDQSLIYYLRGLLLAVPLVLLLWLLQDDGKLAGLDPAFAERLRSAMPKLIAVPLIDAVTNMMRQNVSGTAEYLDSARSTPFTPTYLQLALAKLLGVFKITQVHRDDIRVMLLSLLLLIAVFGLLTLLVFAFRKYATPRLSKVWMLQVTFWIFNLLLGTFWAAVFVLLFLTIAGLAVFVVPLNVFGLVSIVSAFIACAFGVWLMFELRSYWPRFGSRLRSLAVLLFCGWLLTALSLAAGPLSRLLFGTYETGENPSISIAVPYEVLKVLRSFFQSAGPLVPYLGLLGVILLLKKRDEDPTDQSASEDLGRVVFNFGLVVFAGFLVGTQLTWLSLPLPFALAFFLSYRVAFISEPRRKVIAGLTGSICSERFPAAGSDGWQSYVLAEPLLIAARKRLKNIEKKLDSGDILQKEQFATEKKLIEADINKEDSALNQAANEDELVTKGQVVFGVGPFATNWENAAWAVRRGIIFALPILVFKLVYVWTRTEESTALLVISAVLSSLVYWLAAAWFFGYFFNSLRGRTGLAKSAYLSGAVVFPMVLSTTGLQNASFYVVGSFYFFGVLGTWAFDHYVVEKILAAKYDFKIFLKIENSPSLGSIGTMFTSAAVTAISAVVLQVVNIILLYLTFQSLPPVFKA